MDNAPVNALGSVEAPAAGTKAPNAAYAPTGALTPGATASSPAASSVAAVADTLTAGASPGSEAYKVGPHDVLEVTVFKVPDLSKTVQVADAGSVNLPLVGEVQAVGRTAQEIERDLTKRLGAKYLQNPQVSVYVKEFNSRRITIEGAVRKPGVLPFRGQTTLLQVLAMAEGLSELSDSSVVVFRQGNSQGNSQGGGQGSGQGGSKRQAARFDIDDIRAGKTADPAIQAGDVIVAGKSAFKEAYGQFIKAMPIAGVFAGLI